MARNPLTSASTTCPSCGAKFRAGMRRCPRCRAVQAAPDPSLVAATSHRLKIAAGSIAGAFAVLLGGLWLTTGSTAVPPAPVTQPAPPPAVQTAPAEPAPAPPAATLERPFMDPPAAGYVAYTGGDMNAALQHFQEAIARNPNDPEALNNLGQVLVRLDRAADALPYFERAMTIVPDRWSYRFNFARALGVLGRWPEAVASYQRAQELFPNDYATAFNLGLALRKAGDPAAAVGAFQKAIALDPNEPTFRMALGMTYEQLKQPAEAAAAYSEALRLAPDAPDAEVVRRRIEQLRAGPGSAPSPPGAPAAPEAPAPAAGRG